jgi:hypothetical protein
MSLGCLSQGALEQRYVNPTCYSRYYTACIEDLKFPKYIKADKYKN